MFCFLMRVLLLYHHTSPPPPFIRSRQIFLYLSFSLCFMRGFFVCVENHMRANFVRLFEIEKARLRVMNPKMCVCVC